MLSKSVESFFLGLSVLMLVVGGMAIEQSYAVIRGDCSNCHTMHNSQNGQPMATYYSANQTSSGPNDLLTRGTCLGCHAQGGSSEIITIGPDRIPQVYHNAAEDLAGGNFAYITGAKGDGASDNKGHNIIELTGKDETLDGVVIPGGIKQIYHDAFIIYGTQSQHLTCAGPNGCHGIRPASSPIKSLQGAHHGNVDGKLDNPTTVAASYRFLFGVKGLESPNWKNESPTTHNEYFGRTTPVKLGCSDVSCHGSQSVRPPDGTMSQFCATCHGNFHTLSTSTSDGVGAVASSPFIRHPTDWALPNEREYAAYTNYSVEAPVARTGSVPDAPSSTVTPGTDAVMCLSCHYAHASNYDDMLRWDYSKMVAGNAGSAAGTGCFVCHTTKDD